MAFALAHDSLLFNRNQLLEKQDFLVTWLSLCECGSLRRGDFESLLKPVHFENGLGDAVWIQIEAHNFQILNSLEQTLDQCVSLHFNEGA